MSTVTDRSLSLPPGAMVTKPPQHDGTVGVVTSLERSEKRTYTLAVEPALTLGVRCYTEDDEVSGDMVVELHGDETDGTVAIGDWIQFPRSWEPGERVPAITNLTTGRTLTLRTDSWVPIVWALVTMLAAAAIVAVFAANNV